MDSNTRVFFTGDDGLTKQLVPSSEFKGTVEDFIKAHAFLTNIPYVVINADEQPLLANNIEPRQRTFRRAWKIVDGALVTDMNEAKKLHIENIRRIRVNKLAKLDEDYIIAQRDGISDLTELKNYRTALLAATDEVKNNIYSTAEDLYDSWPTILEHRNA